MGNTRVICTASVEETVPGFPAQFRQGMDLRRIRNAASLDLTRTARESAKGKQSGRTQEIQRLIGRSLRAVADLKRLGERTIWIDCDVIQADGGTRTASITGAFVALGLALQRLIDAGTLTPPRSRISSPRSALASWMAKFFSTSIMKKTRRADVDMNFVMTAGNKIVELQATAEHQVFDDAQLAKMMSLARQGIQSLIAKQQAMLGNAGAAAVLALVSTLSIFLLESCHPVPTRQG